MPASRLVIDARIPWAMIGFHVDNFPLCVEGHHVDGLDRDGLAMTLHRNVEGHRRRCTIRSADWRDERQALDEFDGPRIERVDRRATFDDRRTTDGVLDACVVSEEGCDAVTVGGVKEVDISLH